MTKNNNNNNKDEIGSLPEFVKNPNPEVYLSDSYVIVDFETTTHGKGLAVYPQNRIIAGAWRIGEGLREPAAQFGWEPDKTYYRRAGEFNYADVVELLQRAAFVVAHNAKFDLQWLARCGLDLKDVLVYDTLLGEYVLGGNRWLFSQLSLDAISKRRFGQGKIDLIRMMWDLGVPTEDIPESWLERYCVRDVELTERLFLQQRRDLESLGLLPVMYNRCLLTPVLADIEHNGMQLDVELVRQKYAEVEAKFLNLERELTQLTGGINFNSGPQVAEYLYGSLKFDEVFKRQGGKWVPDRTDSGRPKTDGDTIEKLKAKTAAQKRFKELYGEYRQVYSELTKYLRKLLACCDEASGHLLATLNQASTQTHRLSSTGLDYGCQFQNFPRAYKPLFCARHKGWLVGEADGAQLEFRDAVHLGRDAVGLYDIIHGTDIHLVTAGVIWPKENPKDRRQDAKTHTFKPLYGGQSGTEDEKRYYKFFREKYKGIAAWQQKNIDFVLENKYLITEWGLRYYWPDTTMDRSGYVRNSTAICNYPVQAQATAEIIPMAVVCMWHRLKRSTLKMFLVNTVHDSIVCELPPEERDAFHTLSKCALIGDVYHLLYHLYGIRFTVPLGAGVKVASHWGGKDAVDYVGGIETGGEYGVVLDKGEVKYSAPERFWREAAVEAGMIQ